MTSTEIEDIPVLTSFVPQALTSQVVRKPAGEEVVLETSELAVLEGNHLGPEELGLLAKRLAAASNPVRAFRIKEQLTRGF